MNKSPRVVWLEETVRGEKILDIGFVGEYDESLVHRRIIEQNPQSVVVGIDIKKSVTERTSDEAVRGDMFLMPFRDEAFDTIVLAEVLEHVQNPSEVLSEISRVLSTDGRLFITTPNPFGFYRYLRHYLFKLDFDIDQYLGAPDHCQLIDPLSLSNLLRVQNLKVSELTFRNVPLPKISSLPDWSFLRSAPFNRAGGYTCIIAVKKEH